MRNTLLTAAALLAAQPCCNVGVAAELLTVGSKAPALDIEHWVQDGGGKFKPVTKFENGKVYVVEFWATWCGPCVMSMPHLASMQREFAGKGVQIVSVSDEELQTVEEFLDRPVRNARRGEDAGESEEPETYRKLTSAYCLTTDPDQSTFSDYMEAAVQPGIPTAFIVGKKGTVEWIGHPMEMDEPLAAIIEDKWDVDGFAAQFKPTQMAQYAEAEVSALFQKGDVEGALKFVEELLVASPSLELKSLKLQILMQKGDVDAALKYLDGLLEESSNLELNGFKLQILLSSERHDEAHQHVSKLFEELESQPEQVNSLAWSIFAMSAQGAEKMEKLVESSIDAATKAANKVDGGLKANVLDTLAHLHFSRGEVDKAIALETTAVGLATEDERAFYESFLEEITASKAAKSDR